MKNFSFFNGKCIIAVMMLAVLTNVGCGNSNKPNAAKEVGDTTIVKSSTTEKAADTVTAKRDTVTADAPDKAKPTPVHMSLWGNVGGTTFLFDMNGTEGSYIPYNMSEGKEYGARRKLKLESYNPKNGKCVINAYLKGDYIGQFNGIFDEDEVDMGGGEKKVLQSYSGIFKSVKGAKLDFNLYFD